MKTKTILIAVMFCLVATSCNQEKKAIKEVAYRYSIAMANYNVDEAEAYATDETRNTTLVMARRMMKKVGDEYIASDTPATIKILSVEQTSDTTAYAVYHKKTPSGKNFSDTLQLRKRNGEWKAHALIPVAEPSKSQLKTFTLPEEKETK